MGILVTGVVVVVFGAILTGVYIKLPEPIKNKIGNYHEM